MACRFQISYDNFIRWEKIYGDLTIQELQSQGLPVQCNPADLTPPTNLTAVVEGVNIRLNWNDNEFQEANFDIYRSTSSGFTPSASNLIATTVANITTYLDQSVIANVTYYYVVQAVNGDLASAYSNEANAIVPICDITNASYIDSFNLTNSGSGQTGVRFANSGLKMYVTGNGSTSEDRVSEYTLTTGYDISTASFVHHFQVAFQASNPTGVDFNSDGSKMYVCGSNTDSVFEYDLSTNYDISTAVYNSVSLDASTQVSSAQDCVFNNDGSILYILDSGTDTVYAYGLTTNYDLSTASYSNDSFSVTSQESGPLGLSFTSSGSIMLIVGVTNYIHEYSLSTPYDITTSVYNDEFDISSETVTVNGIDVNPNYDKVIIVGNDATKRVYEYSVSC